MSEQITRPLSSNRLYQAVSSSHRYTDQSSLRSSPKWKEREEKEEFRPANRAVYYSPSWPSIVPSGSTLSARPSRARSDLVSGRGDDHILERDPGRGERQQQFLARLPTSGSPSIPQVYRSREKQDQAILESTLPSSRPERSKRLSPNRKRTQATIRHPDRMMGPPPDPLRVTPTQPYHFPPEEPKCTSVHSSASALIPLSHRYSDTRLHNLERELAGPADIDPKVWLDTTEAFYFAPPPRTHQPLRGPLVDFDHAPQHTSEIPSLVDHSFRRNPGPESTPAGTTRSRPDFDDLMSQIEREIPLPYNQASETPRSAAHTHEQSHLTPRRQSARGEVTLPHLSHSAITDLWDIPMSSPPNDSRHDQVRVSSRFGTEVKQRTPRTHVPNAPLSHLSQYSSFPPSISDPFVPSDEAEQDEVAQFGTSRAKWGKLWLEAKNEL